MNITNIMNGYNPITEDPFILCSEFVNERISFFAKFKVYLLLLALLFLVKVLAVLFVNELHYRKKLNDKDALTYLKLVSLGFEIISIPLIAITLFTAFNIWGL